MIQEASGENKKKLFVKLSHGDFTQVVFALKNIKYNVSGVQLCCAYNIHYENI